MNFLFLMDPLETVRMEKDTSFILMLESYRRRHQIYFTTDGDLLRKNGQLYVHATRVIPQRIAARPFIKKNIKTLHEKNIDCVFVRTDPPFDQQYLFHTWLLDHIVTRVPVINDPAGIRTVNEKIWATQFKGITPPTLIGRDKKNILQFLSEQKFVVAKPTNGHGGQSIFLIKKGDLNTNVILETLTRNWQQDIIVQRYLPEAKKGDKRILLLDGEPLGAVLRVHAKDDHRNNFFAGGHPTATKITQRDEQIIKTLKPYLQKLGLYFVGIDVIGKYLTEVNVTSPTCLQEMNRLYHVHLEKKVIDFAEKMIEEYRAGNRI